MRSAGILLLLAWAATPLLAQEMGGPTNEKAKKTYQEAFEYLHKRMPEAALENFKKADKQDDGHCMTCQRNIIKYGIDLHDWKSAENQRVRSSRRLRAREMKRLRIMTLTWS